MDSLFNDLVEMMEMSEVPALASLFEDTRTDAEKRKRPVSVGLQFKRQVAALVATLEACRPSYVRCIKPNALKKPKTCDQDLMLHQVG